MFTWDFAGGQSPVEGLQPLQVLVHILMLPQILQAHLRQQKSLRIDSAYFCVEGLPKFQTNTT